MPYVSPEVICLSPKRALFRSASQARDLGPDSFRLRWGRRGGKLPDTNRGPT